MSFFTRLFRRGEGGAEGVVKKCAKCGAEWDSAAAFCGECGAPIQTEVSEPPPADRSATPQPGRTPTPAPMPTPAPRGRPPGPPPPAPPPPTGTARGAGAERPRGGQAKRRGAGTPQAPPPPRPPPPPVPPRSSRSAAVEVFAPVATAKPDPRAEPAPASSRPPLPSGALSELFSAADSELFSTADPPRVDPVRAAEPPPPVAVVPVGTPQTPGSVSVGTPHTPGGTPQTPGARGPSQNGSGAAAPPTAAAKPPAHEPLTLEEPLSDRPPVEAKAPKSVRPGKPATAEDAAYKQLLDDVDAGFESIVLREDAPVSSSAEPTPRLSDHPDDTVQVRALFEQIAIGFARPVRDFMIEIRWGEPPKEWIGICAPAVTSLRRSAEQMALPELCGALDGFLAALELVQSSPDHTITEQCKEVLVSGYGDLVRVLPDVFALDAERGRREPIIVQSLLLQVPEVRKVALDKIYAAGLTTLDMFFLARAADIADATGLPPSIASSILDKFQSYRREIESLKPEKGRATERARLGALVAELKRQHEEYEQIATTWSKDASEKKKRLRSERAETVLQVSVMLARIGEVDRQNEIEKLPFDKKIRELERYLDEEKRKEASLS